MLSIKGFNIIDSLIYCITEFYCTGVVKTENDKGIIPNSLTNPVTINITYSRWKSTTLGPPTFIFELICGFYIRQQCVVRSKNLALDTIF